MKLSHIPNRGLSGLALVMGLAVALIAGRGALGADGDKKPTTKAIGVEKAIAILPADIKPPDRYAVVIGSSKYQDERIPSLPSCAKDAQAIYDVLTDPTVGMFQKDKVTLLVNDKVTRANVVDALDQLARRAGPRDLVIIFYSGHGGTDERGRAYWIMNDTQIDKLLATALPEVDITRLVGEIKTTRLVMLIDACYSAATANLGKTKALLDVQKIYPEFQGEGRIAITASKGDQLSVVIDDKKDPGNGYSAFAWHVADALRGQADIDGDGVVTVDEVWMYVKDRTERTSRAMGGEQQPQLKGQLGSRFLLTVDAEKITANSDLTQKRIAKLQQFFLQEKLTAQQFGIGRTLLSALPARLDKYAAARRKVYLDLVTDKLAPEYLTAALDKLDREMPIDSSTNPLALLEGRRLPALWDKIAGNYEPTATFRGHAGPITAIQMAAGGKGLVTASTDRTVRLWDVDQKKDTHVFDLHSGEVTCVALNEAGHLLASGSTDQTIRLWDTETGKADKLLDAKAGPVRAVAFLADGQWLVSGGDDRAIRLWDVKSGKLINTLTGHDAPIEVIAVNPDGIHFASGDSNGLINLWDARKGEIVFGVKASGAVHAIAFRPDGKQFAAGCSRGSLHVWDADTGKELALLQRFSLKVDALAYRPDGTLVSASDAGSGIVKVWDVAEGKALQTLFTRMYALEVSSDGQRLIGASGAPERLIKVYELKK
jgi:WD40 repeat protein